MRVYGFTAYGCGFMEIENSLEAKQAFVGGYIEVVDIGNGIDLICNEEGKLNGMMPTAGWFEGGELVDLICGPFILCRSNWEGEFTPIHKEDEEYIRTKLVPMIELAQYF